MKIDSKKAAIAAALAWAGWYTICVFLVAIAPARTQAIFSYVFHYELTGGRQITWPGYFVGVIVTSAWVGAFVATIGMVFNALGSRGNIAAAARRPAPQH